MHLKKTITRRTLLKASLSLSAGACLSSTGLVSVANATELLSDGSGDYKALVYILLAGGNDAHNTLVPMGSNALRSRYEQHRGNVAISEDVLHPINVTKAAPIYGGGEQSTFGLHPSCSGLASLFNNGELSFICNTGNLLAPTSRQQFLDKSVALPPQLFSHSDQQRQFQSEPSARFNYGWGGKVAELLSAQNPDQNVSPLISLSGLNTFQVSEGGSLNTFTLGLNGIENIRGNSGHNKTMLDTLFSESNSTRHLMAEKYAQTFGSVKKAQAVINDAFDVAESNGVDYDQLFENADTKLGKALKTIAKMIAGKQSNTNKRPIYYVTLSGFDTHQNLLSDQSSQLYDVDQAITAFKQALSAQGDFDQVVTFIGSEFGRTLTPNDSTEDAGTDHAWGGMAMIMGGAINGGQLFGEHPDLNVGQGLDVDSARGRWIPTTPTSYINAHIAHWFGVDKAELADIFPSLSNFEDPFSDALNLALFKE
ncbi:DUF1501 domain-containing protein [Thalassotalea agarivorans]|uniref:Uncharacterized conserved protein, DUF1501 family n=1 Tax=Thalassotalea agarivorans TaxID=349064 RepID=A0A1I0GY95_THASX|nr:DUF1501 domain-containing protein [Thalassotalea agarivorans]SET75463.1 Uncharacterized conserved protein, DUF1501 family [Thalassotalea agarivorans]